MNSSMRVVSSTVIKGRFSTMVSKIYDTKYETNPDTMKDTILGYIPGLNLRFGKSFTRSADDSMCEFNEQQSELKRKWDLDQIQRAKSAPKMSTICSTDEVNKSLKDYKENVNYKGRTISPDYPPIAGYTGHIPRVKGNEYSLSQRYHSVAKQGLSLLQEDRNRRNQPVDVENKINNILQDAENKYK